MPDDDRCGGRVIYRDEAHAHAVGAKLYRLVKACDDCGGFHLYLGTKGQRLAAKIRRSRVRPYPWLGGS